MYPKQIDYPHRVKVGRVWYNIVWTKVIEGDQSAAGLCDEGARQITMLQGMGRKEMFRVFIHELIHAMEFEHLIPIPHSLVSQIDEPLAKTLLANFNLKFKKR